MPKLKPIPTTTSSASPYYMLEEAARFLRLRPRTLDNMRGRGVGPVYRKHGGRIIYHHDDLVTWSKSSRRHSSSQRAHDEPARDNDPGRDDGRHPDCPGTPPSRRQSDRKHAARSLPAVAASVAART